MSNITVSSPKELKDAIKEKYDEITVVGSLAGKVRTARKIKKMSPAVLGAIGGLSALAVGALVAVPVSGGLSMAAFAAAAAPVAASSGLSIPVLLIVAGIGVTVLSVLFDEYTEIEISKDKVRFVRRKQSS